MLSGAVEVKVDLSDQSVIAAMDGRVETIAAEVQSAIFTVRRTVAARILLRTARMLEFGPRWSGSTFGCLAS